MANSTTNNKDVDLSDYITSFFKASIDSENKVITPKMSDAANSIAPVYDTVFGAGIVSNNLKKDIENSSSKVRAAYENNPKETNTIDKLITYEIETQGVDILRKDSNSGVKNLLWMNRALNFIVTFLEKCMITDCEKSSKQCATEAYNDILKPYHGIIVSSVVTMAFNLCPSREQLMHRFGYEDEALAKQKVNQLVTAVRPVVEIVLKLLEDAGCNFTDKV